MYEFLTLNVNHAIGLYVIAKIDPSIRDLENNINTERKTNKFRVISDNHLLTLAELMNEYDVSEDDIMSIIQPIGPRIDPIISLIYINYKLKINFIIIQL